MSKITSLIKRNVASFVVIMIAMAFIMSTFALVITAHARHRPIGTVELDRGDLRFDVDDFLGQIENATGYSDFVVENFMVEADFDGNINSIWFDIFVDINGRFKHYTISNRHLDDNPEITIRRGFMYNRPVEEEFFLRKVNFEDVLQALTQIPFEYALELFGNGGERDYIAINMTKRAERDFDLSIHGRGNNAHVFNLYTQEISTVGTRGTIENVDFEIRISRMDFDGTMTFVAEGENPPHHGGGWFQVATVVYLVINSGK